MSKKSLQLVSFEQAQRLKKAGFDWPVHARYDEEGALWRSGICDHNTKGIFPSAPTVALAFKWARDAEGIINFVDCNIDHYWRGYLFYDGELGQTALYKTYEAAERALMDAVLDELEKE